METKTIYVNQDGTKDATTIKEAFALALQIPAEYAVEIQLGAGMYKEKLDLVQNGRDLDAVYGNKNTFDTVNGDGTYYLRVLLFLLNSTRYWGAAADDLTEADIAALMADDANRTMTLALTLNDTAGKEYGYTLRFYNYSGHSLVSITDERAGGAESHYFYVQAREVNRIAEAVIALTQGQAIDE